MNRNGWLDFWAAVVVAWFVLGVMAPAARGEWVQVQESREVPHRRGLLGDIIRSLPHIMPGVNGDPVRYYGDSSDIVTNAHECTHALNSAIRNRRGGTGRVNAAYLPGGYAMVLPEPRGVTVSEVRRRSGNWGDTYLSPDWEHEPLYFADEMSAYICGAVVGLEHGLKERAKESIGRAFELHRHCLALARIARHRGYRHADELDAFLERAGKYIEALTFNCLEPEPQ